jgi:TolB-like protein/Tfp pilus assembly protein PilF
MVMLQNNCATASEIAYCVGFSSPTYFNTCFHDYYGYPPGEVKFRNPKVVEVSTATKSKEPDTLPKAIQEKPSVKKHLLRKRMVWVNTFFIVLLSAISYNLYQNYKDSPAEGMAFTDNQDKSIAILPFKNLSADIDNQYFADGVSGSIQNNLNKISDIKVIASSSMEKYRNSTLTALEIAKEVDVIFLLEGSVQKHGDSIRVITNLVNARNNKQLQSFVFDWEYKNIFDIQTKIALDIAKQLDLAIAPEKLETIKDNPTENLEAYNLYLKGRFFWHRRTEEGLQKSIKYFSEALKLDPDYALAYAGLADSYQILANYGLMPRDEGFNKAKELAQRALSIDTNNAGAHAILGTILCFKDWNWEASEKELKLAIQLNPNYATAHQYYAELLEILGRAKEARKEIDLALSLNPNSWIMTLISTRLYYQDGLYEKAITEAKKAKELNNETLYGIILNCYTYMGKDDEAWAVWEEQLKVYPDENIEVTEGCREAFKKSGIKGAWKFTNDRMVNSEDKWAYGIASNYAYLGETEKALDWLELAYEQRSPGIIRIKKEHDLKNLRSEPRFLALLEKMNLGDYQE